MKLLYMFINSDIFLEKGVAQLIFLGMSYDTLLRIVWKDALFFELFLL